MIRLLCALTLLLAVSCVAAAPTVILNGQPVTLPALESSGKAFVDVAALMQLLGGKASYDAAAGKIYISSTAGAQPAAGGGGGTAASWGTAQLPGDNGRPGQVYSLVKSSPLYFRLNSAEFTVSQVRIGERLYLAAAAEKLLVLHFSIQNPQKTDQLVRFDTLRLTAVDAMNVNHDCEADWGDEQTHNQLDMQLKPAQRIEAYTVLVVPAKGCVPKLMVLPPGDDDGGILRYDLRSAVTGLQAPVADPVDPTGCTALETVPAPLGADCSLGAFDVAVEKGEYLTTALDRDPPADGERYYVVTLRCTNKSAEDKLLRFDTFTAKLLDADGQELEYQNMVGGTGTRAFDQEVKPGTQTRVRIYFSGRQASQAATLTLAEGDSRTYQFALLAQ